MAAEFPTLNFDDPDSDAPRVFLVYMQDLVADGDSRIQDGPKETWITVLSGVSDQFLAAFPSTDRFRWHVMHEKVRLAAATLKLIPRVLEYHEDVFHAPSDLARLLFARLLNFCNFMETWLDIECEPMEGLPTPRQVADKAFHTTVLLLRALGGAVVYLTEYKTPLWKTLRVILAECLNVVTGKPVE
ncbi:hypothetical protein C8R46DRAFT_256342 [Mycena filopes]|nr:hypothetical protein C8R46DRAFT_256342 [Mycena filopes]